MGQNRNGINGFVRFDPDHDFDVTAVAFRGNDLEGGPDQIAVFTSPVKDDVDRIALFVHSVLQGDGIGIRAVVKIPGGRHSML